jgi:hypothetical protein
VDDCVPTSVDQLVEIVNRQKASVLYYSLAAGSLYSWFIVPAKGIQWSLPYHSSQLKRVIILYIKQTNKNKLHGKLYRPSDRRLSVKLVPTFAGRENRMVSTMDPYGF